MTFEEGLDRDLELELENLTFLEDQNNTSNIKQENKSAKLKHKPKGPKPKQTKGKNCNVTPTRTTRSTSTDNENAVATDTSMPRSLRGVWKTTRHGIRKKYRPTHPQNYGCKVCGQLLPSRGQLNEHVRFVKRHSVVLTHGTVTCIHIISTNSSCATDVRRVLYSAVSWPAIKLSIVQLKRASVSGKVVGEISSAKGASQHMRNLMMAKCLYEPYAIISVLGWKTI